jgi:hypothetical protein
MLKYSCRQFLFQHLFAHRGKLPVWSSSIAKLVLPAKGHGTIGIYSVPSRALYIGFATQRLEDN